MNIQAKRRELLQALAGGLLPLSFLAVAQRSDSLRVICGYPPGGAPDIVSRKLAEKLGQRTGAAAIVENKPGAAGRLAVAELKKSPADGRHLLVTPASAMTMYPHVYRELGYDVFADVQPVATIAATAFAFAVGPRVPPAVTDLAGFAAWCRANRAAAQCGNAGAGSMPHFLAILVAREAGIEMEHIPYRGGMPAMQAAAAGEIAAAIATEAAARPLQQAGRIRIVATTAAERTSMYPQAATFREQGFPALVQREWFGVFVPGRTPAATITALADHMRPALADADVREVWEKAGLSLELLGPQELQAALKREYDFWGPTVRNSGFTPE